LNHNASACRIELPDENYELVPESEGEPAEGEVNVVKVQQDPNQSSEGLASDFASEGKPQSITYLLLNSCNFSFYAMLVHLRSGVDLKP
jgi:hypothetical protein